MEQEEWENGALSGDTLVVVPGKFIDESTKYSLEARWLYVLIRMYAGFTERGNPLPVDHERLAIEAGYDIEMVEVALAELVKGGWVSYGE